MANTFPEAVNTLRGAEPNNFRSSMQEILVFCQENPDRLDEIRDELAHVLANRLFDPPLVGATLSLARENDPTDGTEPLLDLLSLYAQSNP